MNIYLVRHGDDDERYRGGWSQLPLIEEGIEKSKKLADFLVGPQDECIKYSKQKEKILVDRIIASDLNRAKMTADIINEKLNVEIKYDERIRENNNGIFAGMLNEEAIKKYPNAFFSNLKYNEKFPEGESPKEFFHRIRNAFFSIIEENNDVENLMIVTHAGVISIIYHIILGLRWTNRKKSVKLPKTSITKVKIEGKAKEICYSGFTPHLK
ncbi:MAG: histidine phosphatase family protein [Clostridia bacterium]